MSISVVVYDSLLADPLATSRAMSDNLISRMDSYSHTINVNGGYTSMNITFSATEHELQTWYEQGLGRRVVTRAPEGNVIWEGFINEISVRIGGLSMSIGPVMDMANQVYVTYTAQRYTAWGISWGGESVTTAAGNDTDSQARFGIMTEYVSGGEGSETEMLTLRDAHLADRAQPFVSQAQVQTPGGSAPSVSMTCVGYHELFEKYVYNDATISSVSASTKIQDVISGDPSSRFSSDYIGIQTNSLSIPSQEEDNKTAKDVLQEIVSYGDSSDNRYTLGVYNDTKVQYKSIDTSITYSYSVTDPASRIVDVRTNAVVHPWSVRPGKWLVVSGLTTSGLATGGISAMRKSPTAMFIESVTFTAPYSLSISSGPTATFAQKISRLGVGLE